MVVKDKKDLLIISLIVVISILLLVLAYLFLIRPAMNGLVVQGQTEGYNYAIQQIASLAIDCKQIPFNLGNNKTINLIAVECLQQAQSS